MGKCAQQPLVHKYNFLEKDLDSFHYGNIAM